MNRQATLPAMSSTRSILLCASDHEQLRLRLSLAGQQGLRPGGVLASVRAELNRAIIVPDEELPSAVVRIGSHVRVQDLKSGEIESYVLTLPEQADPDQGRMSVLAPLGLAVLGYAADDELDWEMPGGNRHLRILAVA
jgi:regulator of nucleoside diphosphate kinase